MGMRLVENLLRSAVEDERLQRLVVIAALLAAREELAVGKRPRAAFAESVVRVGIDRTVAVDLRDVALALRNPFAAFEHDRTVAPLSRSAANSPAGPEPTTTTSVRWSTCG